MVPVDLQYDPVDLGPAAGDLLGAQTRAAAVVDVHDGVPALDRLDDCHFITPFSLCGPDRRLRPSAGLWYNRPRKGCVSWLTRFQIVLSANT